MENTNTLNLVNTQVTTKIQPTLFDGYTDEELEIEYIDTTGEPNSKYSIYYDDDNF